MLYQYENTVKSEVAFPVALKDLSDPRLKHRISLWDGGPADVVLVGMPFDEGVRLNHGRPGAALAPTAFRRTLLGLGTTYDGDFDVAFDQLKLADAGDIDIVPGDVSATHQRLTKVIVAILEQGAVPVLIGGGHDATFASVRGLLANNAATGGINIDAHLDMREVVNGVLHSGTPYRRILEELHLPGSHLVEFGLHPATNSQAHLNYARGQGVKCYGMGALQRGSASEIFQTELRRLAALATQLFVSIDMDVFPAAYAPGVSAPGTDGPTPAEGRELAYLAGQQGAVKIFELMEMNPTYDLDNRTFRLATVLFTAFLAGVATRK